MVPDILEAPNRPDEVAHTVTTPDGGLVLAPSLVAPLAAVRDWWASSQPIGLFELAHRGAERLTPAPNRAILEALAGLAQVADGRDQMWKVDTKTGHISCGTVKNLPERAVTVTEPIPEPDPGSRPHIDPEPDPDQRGLRAVPAGDLHLPTTELTGEAGSYLGRPVSANLAWLTGAAVSGGTPHFNGTGVRVLTWSGQHSSFRASQRAAFLEGIERRVGAIQSAGQVYIGPGRNLDKVITPDDFPAYPDEFYGRRGTRYDPDDEHEWVQVYSLTTGQAAWIPREYVYYGDHVGRHRWALSTSSGCATGSTQAEATLFGLLELIERDAYVASWYARWPVTPVDVSQLPGGPALLARAELLGMTVEAGLLTSPFGVPVGIASVHAEAISSLGTGCHPDPVSALETAINEAWTYIPDRIAMAGHDPDKITALANDQRLVHDIDDHPLLYCPADNPIYRNICGTGEKLSLEEIVSHPDATWSKELTRGPEALLAKLLDRLSAHPEIEVYARVQTSPYERSLGLETVMVVSPQLLPIDFGWDCQRALQSPRLAALAAERGTEIRTDLHPFS